MCGLVLCLSKKGNHAGQQAWNLYKKQQSRGSQGFGYIAIHDGMVTNIERARTEEGIRKSLNEEKAHFVLLHHRMPTSTKNTLGTTHPIFVSHKELQYDYYLAHNGVILNSNTLKPKHEVLGYEYGTEHTETTKAIYKDGREEIMSGGSTVFNDSESLAIEFARFIEGKATRIEANGSAAFWALALEKGTNNVHMVYFGRNKGRDLKFVDSKKWFSVSSETGVDVKAMTVFNFNFNGEDDERELLMSESAPVSTGSNVGYHSRYTQPARNTNYGSATPRAYNSLRNALYTYKERDETGFPPTEFFSVVKNMITYYVPMKFSGMDGNRKRLTELVEDLDRLDFSAFDNPRDPDPLYLNGPKKSKERERLEELALQLAELEQEQSDLDDQFYETGMMEQVEYEEKSAAVDRKSDDIRTKMSALGLPEREVQDVIDEASQLVDYNNGFIRDAEIVTQEEMEYIQTS